MHPIAVLVLSIIGFAYLAFVCAMAYKNKSWAVPLVIFNVLVFAYTAVINPKMMAVYALSGKALTHGGGYKMLTYMFVHANFGHLFFNMLALLFFWFNTEKIIGAPQTFIVYLASGVIGGGVYALFAPSKAMLVGASAAIFGLMAYLTLIRPFLITPMPFLIPMPVSLASVLYTVVALPLFASPYTAVAHSAHLGGMLGGVMLAFGMNWLLALKGVIVVLVMFLITIIAPLVAK